MRHVFLSLTVLAACEGEPELYDCPDPGNETVIPQCACSEASAEPGAPCFEIPMGDAPLCGDLCQPA